jgi:hypothetical protein
MSLDTPPIKIKVTEKIMLKIIKTALKPKTKQIVFATGLGFCSGSALVIEEPPIMHNHDGISGKTQGDKNDKTPALNARKTDKFPFI